MRKLLKMSLLVITMVAVVGIGSAYSLPMSEIRISDGSTTVNILDGGINDIAAEAGIIGYAGSIGAFNLVTVTGVTKPAVGSQSSPFMALTSVASNFAENGSLMIEYTSIGFGPAIDNPDFGSTVGGFTFNGTVGVKTYMDQSNAKFGTGALLAEFGPFTSNIAESLTTTVLPANMFSLTSVISLEQKAPGTTAVGVSIPEPGTLLLIGSGLLGLAFYSRRNK